MTDAPQVFDWTLPAAGAIRTSQTEGFTELAPGLHVETRLLHRRDFRARKTVKRATVETLYSMTFNGRAARIGDANGVPLPPSQSAPRAELSTALGQVAEALNTEVTALATPELDRLVEMLFRDGQQEMTLGRITARSRLGQALSGRRFDRTQNRTALQRFLRRHAPGSGQEADSDAPPTDDRPTQDPWVDRLRDTLSSQPRLFETTLSLVIDPVGQQLSATFRAEHDDTPTLPMFLHELAPPSLTLRPDRFGDQHAQTQVLARCEVERILHLALFLHPWPGWTLSARYVVPTADGTETEIHAACLSPQTSLVDYFGRSSPRGPVLLVGTQLENE